MRRLWHQTICFMVVLCLLCACGKAVEQQIAEQLDLGQRYLSEQKYTEAIVAFQKVIELDDKNVEAYLGLSDVYMAMEDREDAISALETGYKKTQDERLKERLEELKDIINSVQDGGDEEETEVEEESKSIEDEEDKKKNEYDENGRLVRQNYYDENGNLICYDLCTYNTEPGVMFRSDRYLADGTYTSYALQYFSEDGLTSYLDQFDATGNVIGKEFTVSDGNGKFLYSATLNPDGSENSRTEAIYDDTGEYIGWDLYSNGELQLYARFQGKTIVYYNKDGTIRGYGDSQ